MLAIEQLAIFRGFEPFGDSEDPPKFRPSGMITGKSAKVLRSRTNN